MCRIAVYIGPPVKVSSILHDAPHGLADQSRDAKLMKDSSFAGDGWGVGWFGPEAAPEPGLIKSALPLWSDPNGVTAPRSIVSGSIVGHVRFASPGVESCLLNTPLYAVEGRLWTVNGSIEPWPGPISKALRDRLDPDHEADLRGSTDAEMLAALWRTHFRREGGRDDAAVRSMLREAREIVRAMDGKLAINLILAGPEGALAVRCADRVEPSSLFHLEGDDRWRGGTLVASEPLDSAPGWCETPTESLVRLDGASVRVEPLGLDDAP
jgi:glutamine amidotransferase